MKPPSRYLYYLPLIPCAAILALSASWPAFHSFIGPYAKPMLVATLLWSAFLVFLQVRYWVWKKSRDRLSTCHACEYELTGETHVGHCPECGAIFRTP